MSGNVEILGMPEQAAEQLVALEKPGMDSVQLGFFDFLPDLTYFGERILPLLKQAGLRL